MVVNIPGRQIKFGLPQIESISDLANLMRLSEGLIYVNAYYPHYRKTTLKSAKKTRILLVPSWHLKVIQRWLLTNLLEKVKPDHHAFAYRRAVEKISPILANARVHDGNSHFACMDFKDFFPSITTDRVSKFLYFCGYRSKGLSLLVALVTYKGGLPVGAPTSPALSNLICYRLDRRIGSYVEKLGIAYSRYADDLTFSSRSPNDLDKILPTIRKIIQDEGFTENEGKFRRLGPRTSRKITGLVYNGGRFGIGRKQKRRLRALIYHARLNNEKNDKILGHLAYVKSVDRVRYGQLKTFRESL